MNFTISELALAVGKSENFVRQHVNRKHLNVLRQGRKVLVEYDEAIRWAGDRGLPLELPGQAPSLKENLPERVARMMVLTWQQGESKPINLLTVVRHRRRRTLGPWAAEPAQVWSSEVVLEHHAGESEEFRLYAIDAPLYHCQGLVNTILKKGRLEILGIEVAYSLENVPRQHWAYRDRRQIDEMAFHSPFPEYSANVTEYWSFAEAPRARWQSVSQAFDADAKRIQDRVGFPIGQRCDRVGNLIIVGAEDTIRCGLTSYRESGVLALNVASIDGGALPPNTYTAAVWASHSGDDVMRCEVPITRKETIIDLKSDPDRIGFAIYRKADGLCIDFMDSYLLMEISHNTTLHSGATMEIYNPNGTSITRFDPLSARWEQNIELSKQGSALDGQIRRAVLEQRNHDREMASRREGRLARFEPGQFEDAGTFFLELLRSHTYSREPIYLADPYFLAVRSDPQECQLYLKIFEATRGRPLRILCSPKKEASNVKPWWSGYPDTLTGHVAVRKLVAQSGAGMAFHDRYLVTRDQEILMTNSFNGWRKDGVTFVVLSSSVYRGEAEMWWNMDADPTADDILVCEVYR